MIPRDIQKRLSTEKGIYIQVLIGPRQCGKSTLFSALGDFASSEITLDDLTVRNLANNDPALLLSQYPTPLIIDEIQYAPNLFPELKKIVDQLKKARLQQTDKIPIDVIYRLTGSNQLLLDENVKETLTGRASYYDLNTLSVNELTGWDPNIALDQVLFRGGWPEIYIEPELNVINYLNNYIRTYIEKDIVISAKIIKQREFQTVLGMLAARVGQFINYSSVADNSGVKSVTISEWISVLEKTNIIQLCQPYETNLNKRLIKMPKLYFLDTGLCVRLQGWQEVTPMMNSPQVGALFESLVYAEIIKYINNFGKSWKVTVWRTKDGEEIDFIIENETGTKLAMDAKLAIHHVRAMPVPRSLQKTFPDIEHVALVTFGGEQRWLSKTCLQLPIAQLAGYLSENL